MSAPRIDTSPRFLLSQEFIPLIMNLSADLIVSPKPEMQTLDADASPSCSNKKASPLLKLPGDILLLILKHIAPSTEIWSKRRHAILRLRLVHPSILTIVNEAIFANCKLDVPVLSGPLRHFASLCKNKDNSKHLRVLHVVDYAAAAPYPLWYTDLPADMFLQKVEGYSRKVDLIGDIVADCDQLESLTIEVAQAATPYLLTRIVPSLQRLQLRNQAICWDIHQLLDHAPNCSELVLDGLWTFNHSLKGDTIPMDREARDLATLTIGNIDASVVSKLLSRSHVSPDKIILEINGSAAALVDALSRDSLVRRLQVLRLSGGKRVTKDDMDRLVSELKSRLAGRNILLSIEQAAGLII